MLMNLGPINPDRLRSLDSQTNFVAFILAAWKNCTTLLNKMTTGSSEPVFLCAKGIAVKAQIEAVINAVEAAQQEIVKIKQAITIHDPRYDMIDDAQLGTKWITSRLKDFRASTP